MKSTLLLLITVSMMACSGGSSNTKSGAAANLEGYESEKVGASITKAIKKNEDGDVIEEGYISNGKKNGVWLTYYVGDDKGKIKSLAAYTDGMLTGPYYEFSNRGQIETEVNYLQNDYNGKFATYKFGRAVNESHYKNNKLDGLLREYDSRGKLQKSVNYKDGIQHGIMRYYNPEGEVSLEYEYDNGKKISGGIIE